MAEQGVTPDLLPHRALVEEVLGVPLLPEGIAYELRAGEPADIRVTVHGMVLDGIERAVGTRPNGSELRLDSGQLERVRRQEDDIIVNGRRQVVIANNVAATIDRPTFAPLGADTGSTPRAMLQTRIGTRLYDFAQRPHPPRLPLDTTAASSRLAPLQSGLLISSATATGKTVPVAAFAERAGVGKPYAEADPQKQRLLLIVPSVDLLEEYISSDSTLSQWLPGVTFGVFYHKKKQVGGDIDIALDESVPDALASKAINLRDYPTRVIDEGHHAAAPRMLARLGDLSTGKLVLCTATPGRVKRFFVDFTASTARSAAEEGITRPVRILTYQYGPEEHAAEKLAARVASRIIGTGRQVGIYCRPLRGMPDARQARDIATLVNGSEVMLPEGVESAQQGDLVRVIAGASGDQANKRAESDYRAGRLRAYVAIGMLGEGVNVPMDALIILGPRRNQDRWDQIVGRLPRPLLGRTDLLDKPGIIIEIQPREVPEGEPLATTWRTYGLEDTDLIEQGMFIGDEDADPEAGGYEELLEGVEEDAAAEGASRGHDGAAAAGAAADSSAEQAAGAGAGSGGVDEPPRQAARHAQQRRRPSILDELAGEGLEDFLAPPVAVRSITIAPADWAKFEKPAEGSKSLASLAAKYNVPEVWLRRQLDTLSTKRDDITYVGVRSQTSEEGQRRDFERWYGPATEAYLDANPPASLPDGQLMMDIADIADSLGVSRKYIDTVIGRIERAVGAELPRESHLGKSNRPTIHFRFPEIAKIEAEVAKTPVAGVTEVALWDLCQETTPGHVYNFVRARKNNVEVLDRRRRPEDLVNGFARHVSAEDAARIREAFYNPALATVDDISIADMARRAEMTLGGMLERIAKIPEDERPDIYNRKLGPKGRMADHMNRAEGLAIVEEARPYRLPPDRVTSIFLDKYFKSHRKTILGRIRQLSERGIITEEQAQARLINLGGQGGETSTWTWEVMRAMEEHTDLQRAEGLEPVDYDLLARGPYDPDWQYSQQVQSWFIDKRRLAQMPARDKVLHLAAQSKVKQGAVLLTDYAETRKVRLQDVFAALAIDDIPLGRLYYEDAEQPGNPMYLIAVEDVPAFDRYFRPAAEVVVRASGSVAVAAQEAAEPAREMSTGKADTDPTPAPGEVASTSVVNKPASAPPAIPPITAETPNSEPRRAVDVAQELKCSGAALAYLIAADPRVKDDVTKRESDGATMLSAALVGRMVSRIKRLQPTREGWMRHEMLAKQLGVTVEELAGAMRQRGVQVREGEVQVVRVFDRENLELDASYAPRVWRNALAQRWRT